MLVLITGANGFLGSATVAAARRAGHTVRALVRRRAASESAAWRDTPGVTPCIAEFSDEAALQTALLGCDAVIHIAAAMRGNYEAQYAATVTATDQLLAAMTRAQVRRLVAISSMALYDYSVLPANGTLTESSALAAHPETRDTYMQVKMLQESHVRAWSGGAVTILRPGIIYGRNALWSSALGQRIGARRWVAIVHDAEMPLTYIDNCADAVVAALAPGAVGATLNVVDDERPSSRAFLAAINALPVGGGRSVVAMPMALLRLAAVVFSGINRSLFRGRLPLPGWLVPERVDARFKPLRYANAQAKALLGWRPAVPLTEALSRSV